jgi:hypothetical protein
MTLTKVHVEVLAFVKAGGGTWPYERLDVDDGFVLDFPR